MVLREEEETSRIYVEKELLEELRKAYPETKRMTYTGIVDWAIRKLLNTTKEA